ncbi:MAG: NUDIX domain-containing protein [Deltaproteobacteria bacterium]|nr:MAG: NUDIX domain-containing protein [Deltaproteobacteria bacterium]
MSHPASPPAAPVAAASVLLLRDAPDGLEVFMQRRSRRVDFSAGAMVFPGGRVDAADADPALRARCCGADELEDRARALRVAAIREVFEECGVLLARPRGATPFVSDARVRELREKYRSELQAARLEMARLAENEDLELACDRLIPFAHWITPTVLPKRFDTLFFLAEAPPHAATHDGSESVASEWIRPGDALAAADAGRHSMMFPTRLNLAKLGASASVRDAIDAARRGRIVTVLPEVRRGPEGPVLRIPADAGYGVCEFPVD